MHFMKKLTLLASAIALAISGTQVLAEQITGQVANENGRVLSDAVVKVMGTNNATKTDYAGTFTLNVKPGSYELHITAQAYVHKNIMVAVSDAKNANLSIKLDKSAIEIVDVTATPFHSSNIESALPITVLHGESLRMRQANTLGDTLAKEVGVHSSFHGGVASTPIIRGLDGPRVLITQNGLDAGDASRVGPDHAVSTETSTSERIEVLRGPATLFYGSGAIGGVVNVVDERVPTSIETKGEWQAEANSGNGQEQVSGSLNTGIDNVAFHVDGFWREAENYTIPEKNGVDEVENSASESKGFTLGTSYLLEQGFVGLSYQNLEQEYGIPGHSHGDENVAVFAELTQHRWQLLSELHLNNNVIRSLNTKVAYTDYKHHEVELGIPGTTFNNESLEARVEILHQDLWDWRGGFSVHYKESDFTAIGLEAFTPPSTTDSIALAWMEERHFGNFLLQLGTRIEHTEISANKVRLPDITLMGGHEAEHNDAHGRHDEVTRNFEVSHVFKPVSFSAGLVWDFTDGYNIGLSLSQSQRAPSSSELLSFGPHIGTGTYEVGALFERFDDEHHGTSIGLTDDNIVMETANNIDLSLRKFKGDFGFIFNVFYNQIDDYYYQENTGLSAGDGHGHSGHDHGSHDEVSHSLPLYIFTAQDVELHGMEVQVTWQFADNFTWKVQGDVIRARLTSGEELPRTPPARLATELSYQGESISADLFVHQNFEQSHVAVNETTTDGYLMVDANINYHFNFADQALAVYLKGSNLTDEYANVHTSFLKDLTPLAGRSFALGIRGSF